jgi:hypothetical protein
MLRNAPEECRYRLRRAKACLKSGTQQSQLFTFSNVYHLTAVLHSGCPAVCVNCNKSVLYGQQSKMAGNSS